jgi:transposase
MIMKKIPKFKTDGEAARFWESHSFEDYYKDSKEAGIKFVKGAKRTVAVRLDPDDIKSVEKIAEHKALRVGHGLEKVVYGMEPTANYHKPLGEYLISLGRTVVLVSGVMVAKNRESLDGRWDKHDVKDSANVADLISQGKCLYYEHPSAELRGLRGLLSLKRRLKRQEQSYRVRIRNHLMAQYFPEMDSHYGRSETEGLAIVRWCFPPSQITELDVEPFIQRVTSRRIGMEKRRRLEAIWEKAGMSIGCDGVPGVDHEAIASERRWHGPRR